MITGEERPDKGVLTLGQTVTLAYVDQVAKRPRPSPDRLGVDLRRARTRSRSGKRWSTRAPTRRASTSWVPTSRRRSASLSGGERNRLHLARMLRREANVILLDEPTNDLDVNTMRALEDAIERYAGCLLIVSHDRWFLDRVATHILAFEGDSKVYWFEGNWSEYEADRKRRLGTAAERPHRIRYRPLTRA